MPIICGTDFSNSASEAALAAAELAQRLDEPFYLVHAMTPVQAGRTEGGAIINGFAHSAIELMSHAADALRDRGFTVCESVEIGEPATVLSDLAARTGASMIFVGGIGAQPGASRLMGNTAEHTSREAKVPVISLRDTESFHSWLLGKQPLRIVVATDLSSASQAAVEWVSFLRRAGRIEVILAHVFWPPEAHERLQLPGPFVRPGGHPIVREVIERELGIQSAALGGPDEVRMWSAPSLGRPADPLVELASIERADLLVVGSHGRGALDRLWQGSVSQTIARLAPMSVACVPVRPAQAQRAMSPIRTILAATDFSITGNIAVAHAYAIATAGCKVILMHVVKTRSDRASSGDTEVAPPNEYGERLRELIPSGALLRGIESEVRVVEGRSISAMICAAAERSGADVVVVGTEGRSGLARPIFGSTAQEVMLRSRFPVLIVPPAHVLETRPLRVVEDPELVMA
jgi:nucleotide-binding universal stress UspA family protein